MSDFITLNENEACSTCGHKGKSVSAPINEALLKEIYREVDGYFVWDTGRGYLNEHHLRAIADELDKRNSEWDKRVSAETGANVPSGEAK